MTRRDALIIGGGPAGAATAILLAKAGWAVDVVEKSAFPRRKVCGEFLSVSNASLLEDLGVTDAFRSRAGPDVRRVAVFAGNTTAIAPVPAGRGRGGWGRALGRETLDAMLLDRAASAGARVWQPWKVVEIARLGDGFTCRTVAVETGAEALIESRVVIAAHGSWDPGPLPTSPQRAHGATDLLAFKAHFHCARLPPDLMALLAFPGGYGGMVHTSDGRVSLSCCIRRDVLGRLRERSAGGKPADVLVRHVLQSCAGARDALTGAHLDGRWLAAGPIAPGLRRSPQPGIFLVGNAAGEAHPIVAEGISMALQGAGLLARRLLANPDPARPEDLRRAGDAYAQDWRAAFGTRLRAAGCFAALAMRPGVTAALGPLLERFPQLITLGAELSGKTEPARSADRDPRLVEG